MPPVERSHLCASVRHGCGVGAGVGDVVGAFVGAGVGDVVGAFVGAAVGAIVGAAVGAAVGGAVGAAVKAPPEVIGKLRDGDTPTPGMHPP